MKPFVTVAIVVVILLLAFLLFTTNRKAVAMNSEKFAVADPASASVAALSDANPAAASAGIGELLASEGVGREEVFNPIEGASAAAATAPNCFPRDRLTGADLLPKSAANSAWAQANPAGQGSVGDTNFLSAGYHIGVNTQGSSMRNANLQLRSEPANPRVPVSPWQQSTIEPDFLRKPLE